MLASDSLYFCDMYDYVEGINVTRHFLDVHVTTDMPVSMFKSATVGGGNTRAQWLALFSCGQFLQPCKMPGQAVIKNWKSQSQRGEA